MIFKSINKENGLPGSEVYKLIQDKKGYIWGISEGGVFKYNGEAFKSFTIKDGLPGYTFFNLFEDSKGKIWVSNFDGKIGYFLNNEFHPAQCNDSLSAYLQFGNKLIYDLYVDKSDTVWLGTGYRLIKISPIKNYSHFEELKPESDSVGRIIIEPDRSNLISSTSVPDKFGVNFTGYNNGKKFQYINIHTQAINKTFRYYYNDSFTAFPYIRQVVLSNGEVLFSFLNTLVHVQKNGSTKEYIFDNQILNVVKDKNQNLWVCFAKGGLQFYSNCDLDSKPKHYLRENSISNILIDHEDGLWVSSLGNGIFYSPNLNATTFHSEAQQNKIIGLSIANNNLYSVNRNHQFLVFDHQGECILKKEIYRPYNSDQVKIYDRKNNLFICGGITGWYTKYLEPLSDIKNEKGEQVTAEDVAFITNDSVYILTHSNLYLYYKTTVLKKFQLPSRGKRILAIDSANFFIGTINGLYNFRDGIFNHMGNVNQLLKTRVNYLYADSEKRIWVCTKGSGILYRKNHTWHSITTTNGIADDLCTSIVEGEKGVFYIGTQNGVSKLKFMNDSIYSIENYYASNGLQNTEVTGVEYFHSNLYVGTQKGLSKIDARQHWQNKVPPPIYISKIILNDSIAIDPNRAINLTHLENNLTFHVDVLTFKDAGIVKIKYTLKGENTVTKIIKGNKIELQNLNPGKYLINIYGINNNGIYSRNPATFSFTIDKPYWFKWWFILTTVFSLILMVFLFVKWRINTINKRNKEQLDMQKKLSAFKLQALRAQMNPHFVFNAINSIQSQILQKKQHEAYSYLTKFSRLIRTILVNTNEDMVSLSKEVESICLYIELEQLRFDEQFEFELLIDDKVDQLNTIIPSMIIQPFLENAIWHGLMPLNGLRKAKLKMNIKSIGEKISVIIEDNGIGRDKSASIKKNFAHKSLGINLIQQRLELISMSNSSITITDITDGENLIIGTRVEIIL